MAEFNFSCTIYLGFSHCGEVTAEGKGTIELSDEEVAALVVLMREKGSTDVNELNLEEVYPEIYEKLADTCDSVAWNVALAEAARDAHYYDEDDTFLDKLQEYCESEYNYDESQGDFRRWFTLLIQSWSSSQICNLYNKAGIELCWDILEFDGIETCDYEVTLPQSIVSMVFDV